VQAHEVALLASSFCLLKRRGREDRKERKGRGEKWKNNGREEMKRKEIDIDRERER
jgi:hypothetical protein